MVTKEQVEASLTSKLKPIHLVSFLLLLPVFDILIGSSFSCIYVSAFFYKLEIIGSKGCS